jgi:hypothetical protein
MRFGWQTFLNSQFLQRNGKMNEFFWKEEGLFTIDGSELAVPNIKRNKDIK